MNTLTLEELDREEIEFLPSRVVMTTCNPCYRPCQPCEPIRICVQVRLGCLLACDVKATPI